MKPRKLKVGHGGALDPLASGVLVLGVGKGTKVMGEYLSGQKRYTARVRLGFETNTLDMDEKGVVVREAPFEHVTAEAVAEALGAFRGDIMQKPPLFSALKRDGKKLYQLARDDGLDESEVEIPERPVRGAGGASEASEASARASARASERAKRVQRRRVLVRRKRAGEGS